METGILKYKIEKGTTAYKFFMALAGIVLFAVSYSCFLAPCNLYSGGFTGVAQLIDLFMKEILHIRLAETMDLTGIISWLINIPLFLLGYRSIGKRFFGFSVGCVCVQSVLLTIIPIPSEPLLDNTLLNAVIGGIISGTGVGLTLREGGSGGGMDIVGMYAAKKIPGFSVGKTAMIINSFIFTVTALRYDLNITAYSLIFCVASVMALDRMHYQNIQVTVVIVSRRKDLGEIINRQLQRGVTSWGSRGEYLKEDMRVYLAVVSKYEWIRLKTIIVKEDPNAFVQVYSPGEIIGNYEKRLEMV